MIVEIEGKGSVEFPDGTDPAVIDAAVKRDFFGGGVLPPEQPTPVGLDANIAKAAAEPVAPVAPIPAAPAAAPKLSALEMIQKIKGTPVAPGMPASVAEVAPQGLNERAQDVLVKPILRAPIETARTAALLSMPLQSEEGKQKVSTFIDNATQTIKNLSPKADPGFIDKFVAGAVGLVPYLATGGPGAVSLLSNSAARGIDALDQGVDPNTATALALKDLTTTAAMFKLPMGGKTVPAGMAKGAAVNVGLDVASKGAEKGILNAAGYPDQAGKVDLLNPSDLGQSAAMGAAFGAQQTLANRPRTAADIISEIKARSGQVENTPPASVHGTETNPAQPAPVLGPETPPMPESRETVQAQLDALAEGRKPAVLITPGEKLPASLPFGAKLADLPEGILIYKEDAALDLAKSGKMGQALGYGIDTKPPKVTNEAVVARDAQGRLVQGVLTDGSPDVLDAAVKAAGPGGTVEKTTATQVIADRLKDRAKESMGSATIPAEEKPQPFAPPKIDRTQGLDSWKQNERKYNEYAVEKIHQLTTSAANGDAAARREILDLFHDRHGSPLLSGAGNDLMPGFKYKVFMDVDNFKDLNDKLDYAGADYVLGHIGKQLDAISSKYLLDESNTKHARIMGDEFASESDKENELKNVYDELRNRLARDTIKVPVKAGSTIKLSTGEMTTLDHDIVVPVEKVGISYGLGETTDAAKAAAKADKRRRADAGLRTERKSDAGGPVPGGAGTAQPVDTIDRVPAVPAERVISPTEREYLGAAANAVRGIEYGNIILQNADGEAVRANRSYSTRKDLTSWLPYTGYTHAAASDILERAHNGEFPKDNETAKWRIINEAITHYQREAENAAFEAERVRTQEPGTSGFPWEEERVSPIVRYKVEAEKINSQLPSVRDGFSRLWRGNRINEKETPTGFTNDLPGIALPFAEFYKGFLTYVDVPNDVIHKNSIGTTDAEFNIPKEWAIKAKIIHDASSSAPKEDFALTAADRIEQIKKGPEKQAGLDLGLKGADLRAPERENRPVSMDETPLGKATNEAADREKQEKLYSFPGPVRKDYDAAFDFIGKGLHGIAEFSGKHTPPWIKDTIGKAIGLPNFTAGGNDPYRKPLVNLNLDRADKRTEEAYKVLMPEPDKGYAGAKATVLRGQDAKDFDDIARMGDARWQKGELQWEDANGKKRELTPDNMTTTNNPTGRTVSQAAIDAYRTNREMLRREQEAIVEGTKRIALAPYEKAEFRSRIERIFNDLLELPDEGKQEEYLAGLMRGGDMPADVQAAIYKVRKYADLIHEYQGTFEAHPWYLPRTRPQGEFVVRGYDRSQLVDGKPLQVFMGSAKTQAGAMKLKASFEQNPEKHLSANFREDGKYIASWDRSKQFSEDLYQGIGNRDAMEAVIRQAVEKVKNKGVIGEGEVDALDDALYQTLAETLAARGAGRHFIQRHETLIEGYDTEDLANKMISQVNGIVGWLSKAEYAIRGMEAMKEIPTNRPSDVTWAHNYFTDSLRNSGTADRVMGKAKGLATVYYMGLDIADAVQNSFQHYLTAIPEMSKFTENNVRVLEEARKDIVTRNLTEFDRKVLDDAIRQGTGRAQYVRDVSGTSESPLGSRFDSAVQFTMKPFQAVEQYLNREPAYLAAMRLFTGAKDAKGRYYGTAKNGKPYSMSYDEAMQRARDFVDDTHYVLGKENRPELVRKIDATLPGVGSAAYTFTGFSHNYFHWLFTRATSGAPGDFGAAARSLVVLSTLGGAAALPLVSDFDEWAQKFFGAMPMHRLKREIRDYVRDYAGEGADAITDVIMNGLPSLVGVDFSKKASVGVPIVSGDRPALERIFGPWSGLAQKAGQGIDALYRGDYGRAVEKFSPQMIEHGLSGLRMATKGATTLRGKEITDEYGQPVTLTQGEAILKGAGFQPMRLSRLQDLNSAEMNLREHWEGKRQDLLDAYRISGGSDKLDQEIDDFNKTVIEDPDVAGLVSPINGRVLRNALGGRVDRRELMWKQEQMQ